MRVVKYHLCKRGDTYYFIKRVPKDVRRLHSSGWIKQSLRTADLSAARSLRDQLLKELDAKWTAYRALPHGKHISRDLLNEALRLRSRVLDGEDRKGWLETVNERAVEIYDEGVPWEVNGRVASQAAGEFYSIASGEKLPFNIAVDQFFTTANLKPSTRGLYRGLTRLLSASASLRINWASRA